MKSKIQFVALLNEDLALEYSAAIQYEQHAASLTGLEFAFAGELRDHASDEMRHARMLNEHITYLGGVPSVKVGEILTASDSEPMLRQDLSSETTAIQRYEERIKQCCEAEDFCTEAVLLSILKDEVSHKTELEAMLDE